MKESDKVQIIPFKAEHAIELADNLREDLKHSPISWQQMQNNEFAGPAFTGLYEGKVVGCGGMVIMGDRAVAWALFSRDIKKLQLSFFKYVKKYLEMIVAVCDIKRLEAHIQTGFPEAEVFAQHLGFEREGVPMKNFIGGHDYLMYVKHKEQ
jgi:hypothetical protein